MHGVCLFKSEQECEIILASFRLTVNLEGQAAPECGNIVVNRVNPRVFLDNLEFR